MIEIIRNIIEYVIYARRSREEEEKQQASIPQQIEKCMELYEKGEIKIKKRPKTSEVDDLTIVEIENDNKGDSEKSEKLKQFYIEYYIVTERHSAKEPDQRKQWNELVKLIKRGKINGLMGYSPDRFARNMPEGGDIIHFYGTKKIDLRFTNAQVENNATGLAMLGFLFLQASFYSNKLSEDVTRGSAKKHLEGYALGQEKYGYITTENQRYEPHPVTFKLLREAFEKKLYENWSDYKIVEYLNEKGWNQVRRHKRSDKTQLSTKMFSKADIWNDTFYYGLYKRSFKGKELIVDFRKLQCSDYQFTPLITEDEYFLLQEKIAKQNAHKVKLKISFRSQKNDCIKPIPEGAIIHEKTNTPMHHNLSNPARFERKAKRLNKEFWQVIEPKQIHYRYRGHEDGYMAVSWEQVAQIIKSELEKIHFDRKEYQGYLKKQKQELEKQKIEEKKELKKLKIELTNANRKHQQFLTSTNYGQNLDGNHKETWQKEDNRYQQEISKITAKINKIKANKPTHQVREEKFVRLLEEIPEIWGKANYVRQRHILEILLSHIKVKNDKQLIVALKPEIVSIFKEKITCGGPKVVCFTQLSNFVKRCEFDFWQRIEGVYDKFFGNFAQK